ncbi:hypothetical protein COW36_05455 [bacterium (Candidatus Blackallbacteria) CG17_big_fil_post_rev_8_21_14_2_50_48_46]|uniref:SMP-30/Gluconolactonase/LRE-like region domain-containing protein n=1 Tax=bacterium (Candidatus Blackallbacteria) CG17_big_fil_post_rev_8_21_14_2_50_48_46 TaxID=2014261 RepID=A0A2M7G819_9BACT|nr:MAG: hypothetical protein COW64_21050 [bacterium (Candidatus Blackallbacteria) CG18_big_fil_WC_8_21_14_2_50_49_26]PIW18214.1 MAG: hypothetical protein COW36_05455 [bacterium (Candidatus Blackallbacteria) CG17_big_fil_post_rev_8_21_14_2_50_48_46]PIW50645.1 MAG: hypothetical protein COW20_01720 [bacterium (Candidatus Blackallbacteria) CG13_big_fil_rev_8_21_14_2_50_49_14]
MKRHQILAALTLTLSLTACGGSVNSPGSATVGSLGASSLSSLSDAGSSGITPIESLDDSSSAVAPIEQAAAPELAAPLAEEAPALDAPLEEAPAVDTTAPALEQTEAEVPAADAAQNLDEIPDMDLGSPYVPSGSSLGGGAGYIADGNYKVDQDTFNQWQPVSVVSDGSSIYVAAVDVKTPTKGTVIQMDTSGGSWKDLGKSLLSTFTLGAAGYKMPKTIQAATLDDSGNLIVTDAQSKLYRMDAAAKYSTTAVDAALSDALDLTTAGGNIFVATTSGIQKFDASLSAGSAFSTVIPSGGVGHDSQGNLYVVSNNAIQKIDSSGNASQVVSGLTSPLDVSVDSEGTIFVLETDGVKYFKSSGESLGSFGSGDFSAPKSLFVDSSGTVFVADSGASYKESQIVRFTKG